MDEFLQLHLLNSKTLERCLEDVISANRRKLWEETMIYNSFRLKGLIFVHLYNVYAELDIKEIKSFSIKAKQDKS